MSVRYRFIHNPKTTVYETPAEAYLILSGTPQTYKVTKSTRKRNERSANCNHRAASKPKRDFRTYESKNSAKRQRRCRFESDDRRCRTLRSVEDEQQNQRERDDSCSEAHGGGQRNSKRRAMSSLNFDFAEAPKGISCNYPKQL
jgi:hypothetical protein